MATMSWPKLGGRPPRGRGGGQTWSSKSLDGVNEFFVCPQSGMRRIGATHAFSATFWRSWQQLRVWFY